MSLLVVAHRATLVKGMEIFTVRVCMGMGMEGGGGGGGGGIGSLEAPLPPSLVPIPRACSSFQGDDAALLVVVVVVWDDASTDLGTPIPHTPCTRAGSDTAAPLGAVTTRENSWEEASSSLLVL